jgi:hypothetical protein
MRGAGRVGSGCVKGGGRDRNKGGGEMLISGWSAFASLGFNGRGALQWMMLSIAWHKGRD